LGTKKQLKRKLIMTQLKLTNDIDNSLPIWNGVLETDVEYADIKLGSAEGWIEQPNGTLMLSHTPQALDKIMHYFSSEAVLDNLLDIDLGDAFTSEWPTPLITDPAFLKSALGLYPKITRLETGTERLPGGDDRLLFGRIVVKLDDYLLSPPTLFVGNTDWPATDIVYATDHDYMGAVFYLNSNMFHTAWENKTKRNIHLLEVELRLDPLFLAK
jgi:hypothetical protein